jgi:cysteine desulfurase/selenocysteine lyase
LVTNGIITFNLSNYHAHDIVDYLAKNDILIRGGDFCCPYLEKIIGSSFALRISFGPYNNYSDIDKLINNLKKIIQNPSLLIN